MSGNSRNIIVGAARIWLSAAVLTNTDDPITGGAPVPTLVSGTKAATTLDADANWVDVGYTTNGLDLTYTPTYGEVQVDQLLDAAMLFKSDIKVDLKTTFAEATLKNLFIVLNQKSGYSSSGDPDSAHLSVPNAVSGVQVNSGQLGDFPVERSLIAVGPGPRSTSLSNTERIYYAYRVMSMDPATNSMKRDTPSEYAVTFRLLAVSAYSNGYGKIVDRQF